MVNVRLLPGWVGAHHVTSIACLLAFFFSYCKQIGYPLP